MNPLGRVSDYKEDNRPIKGGWAPGDYTNRCRKCNSLFFGDNRAVRCADCAYEKPWVGKKFRLWLGKVFLQLWHLDITDHQNHVGQ